MLIPVAEQALLALASAIEMLSKRVFSSAGWFVFITASAHHVDEDAIDVQGS
jgi:hypothetical protein